MRPKSIIELSENLKSLYIETAQKLKGSNRRQFMAAVVKELGIGGQIFAEQNLGWNRPQQRRFEIRGTSNGLVNLPGLMFDRSE